ncbi:MAG TPA: Rid family detoxifying hydrolase [bacterium]
MKTLIKTKNAPEAIGPYSQAIAVNGFLFTAGQIPIVPATGKFIEGGIKEQTRQVLENVKAVIEAGNSSMSMTVKTTVYLTNAENFTAMNEVYATYFNANDTPPARSTVFVVSLPKGALVEIDAVTALD